jgi:hypothetical protein
MATRAGSWEKGHVSALLQRPVSMVTDVSVSQEEKVVYDIGGSRSRSESSKERNNASVTLASNAVNAPVFVKYRQGSFVEALGMSSWNQPVQSSSPSIRGDQIPFRSPPIFLTGISN